MNDYDALIDALSKAYTACAKVEFETHDPRLHKLARKACFDLSQARAQARTLKLTAHAD